MKQDLMQLMELGKLDKGQLVQLCNALYVLLQERNVNVTVQQVPTLGSLGGTQTQPPLRSLCTPNVSHHYLPNL